MKPNHTFEDVLKKAKNKKQGKVELIRASDVTPEAPDWLWEGHLQIGALELLSGLPALGKSQLQIHLMACVTAGLPWPDGTMGMDPANVIMMTAEDNIAQVVVPRLIAAGADMKRVRILKCIKTDNPDRQFLLGEDLEALKEAADEVKDVALITVDPITAYMGGTIDSHKTTEVRSQLGPLKDFAEDAKVAISAITHPAKNPSSKAIDHFIGSQAFIAACRIGHVCVKEFDDDGNETGRVLFTNAKPAPNSIRRPTLAYKIEGVTVTVDVNGYPLIIPAVPRIVWEKDTVDITADEAVRAASSADNVNDKQQHGQREAVRDFLRDLLKDGQPVPAKGIIEEAEKLGFSTHQLDRAKRKLKVTAFRNSGGWQWQIVKF